MENGMTVKEWVGRGIGLEARIRSLKKSKDRAYAFATASTASTGGDVVSNSGVSRKSESYTMLAAELDAQLEKWDAIMAEITCAIGLVQNHTLAALLQARYVRGLDWWKVADELGYSEDYVKFRLHERAIHDLEQTIEDASKCS